MLVFLQIVCLMWSFIGLYIALYIDSVSNRFFEKNAFHWPNKNNKQKAFLIFLTGPAIWLMGGMIMVGMKIIDLCLSGIDRIMNLLK